MWPFSRKREVVKASGSPHFVCPKCGSPVANPQGPMVEPRADGSDPVMGQNYGCPRCSVLWGVTGGVAFVLGDRRKALDGPPAAPTGPTVDGMSPDKRERMVRSDDDMLWRR